MSTQTEQADSIAQQTAKILLEIEAIHIRPKQPFTLTSGRLAPVYVDCRKVISYPRARRAIIDAAAATLFREAGFEAFDAVAGGETAGIPYAAWLADKMNLPMLYVRKKPKGFGRNAQIEGTFPEGARVLLVEDLSTDGKSKEVFVKALRDAGAVVDHVFVVFHNYFDPISMSGDAAYRRRSNLMKELGVTLHPLANWGDVLDFIHSEIRYGKMRWQESDLETLKKYLTDPEAWSDKEKSKLA
ncbi:MAG: orotate phosphoribosyltransferase [Alphaproteobacteria bacterium]|nr:orotate phosphoribosyltransferase [Alphaproteobacteria bacterium]